MFVLLWPGGPQYLRYKTNSDRGCSFTQWKLQCEHSTLPGCWNCSVAEIGGEDYWVCWGLILFVAQTAGESWVLLRVYSSRDIRWEWGIMKGFFFLPTRREGCKWGIFWERWMRVGHFWLITGRYRRRERVYFKGWARQIQKNANEGLLGLIPEETERGVSWVCWGWGLTSAEKEEDECGLCSKYLKRRKTRSCRLRKFIRWGGAE